MKRALTNKSILRLWLGQAFSCIGDEIYKVGLIWLAVGVLKTNAGLLSAGQMATLLIASMFGGKWADNLDPLTTMIRVDLLRAFLVLIPVVFYFFGNIPFPVFVVVAFSISGLSAFFDPAVQATLPIISKDADTLRDTNGLMSTTTRSARLIGPMIISFLAAIIPMIHFFTVDAFTFLVSAFSVFKLSKIIDYNPELYRSKDKPTFKEAVVKGFKLAQKHSEMKYIFIAKAITSSSWNLAFNLGFVLMVHEKLDGNIKTYGYLVAAYGLGNLIGAIIFGSLKRNNSPYYIFLGYIFFGLGFIGVGAAHQLNYILGFACYAGLMGPLNDLAFIEHLQSRYAPTDLPKIFRLRQSVETSAGLCFMLLSPLLFNNFGASRVILAIGILWILIGLLGINKFKNFI